MDVNNMKLAHHFLGTVTIYVQYVFDDPVIEAMSRLHVKHMFK
jgi:hypothetical protein